MNRSEIEITLNTGRAWLLETYTALPAGDVTRPVTPSEHDAANMWSPKDHLVHLAGIERNFNAMIRRHLTGDANPVGLTKNPDGSRRELPEIMKTVHAMNDDWLARHRDGPLDAAIALGQHSRAETLALLAELTDAQLQGKLPGAPWADGTIGGVLAVNAQHEKMHWTWITAAMRPAG